MGWMDWVGYRYFTMLMIFGGLFLTNYLLAECCVVFTSHMKNFQLMKDDLAMLNARAGARSPSLRLQNPYEIFFAHCIMQQKKFDRPNLKFESCGL